MVMTMAGRLPRIALAALLTLAMIAADAASLQQPAGARDKDQRQSGTARQERNRGEPGEDARGPRSDRARGNRSGRDVAAANALAGCNRLARASGSDAASGEPLRAPVKTFRRLMQVLQPGEVGCLMAGEVFQAALGEGYITKSNITLTSTMDSQTPAAILRGQFMVNANTSNVTIDRIKFDGEGTLGATPGVLLLVLGDNFTLRNSVITAPRSICIQVGKATNPYSLQPNALDHIGADNVVIERNRIFGCGLAKTYTAADSGDHGIYAQVGSNLMVRDNYIYDNRFRGMQTWPGMAGAKVLKNVFDGNGSGFSIGALPATGWFTTGLLVEGNILSNGTQFLPPKNQYQIAAPDMPTGNDRGNVVQLNCFYQNNPADNIGPQNGFIALNNVLGSPNARPTNDPVFADRGMKDFRLRAGSPCAGKGPATANTPPNEQGVLPTVPGGNNAPLITEVSPQAGSTVRTAFPTITFQARDGEQTLVRSSITGFLLCPGATCARGQAGAIDLAGQFSGPDPQYGWVRHERWFGAVNASAYPRLAPGQWTARVAVSDGAITTERSWTFTVAPQALAGVSGVPVVTRNPLRQVSATIPSTVDRADVHLHTQGTVTGGCSNTTDQDWTLSVSGTTYTWTLAKNCGAPWGNALPEGTATVNVVVAGGQSGDAKATFPAVSDRTAPSFASLAGLTGTKTVRATMSPDLSGIATVEFRWRPQPLTTANPVCTLSGLSPLATTVSGGGYQATLPTARGTAGRQHLVWARATDRAGNAHDRCLVVTVDASGNVTRSSTLGSDHRTKGKAHGKGHEDDDKRDVNREPRERTSGKGDDRRDR